MTTRELMELAIAEMNRDPRTHKIGAVLAQGDRRWSAHGQQIWEWHHAESALLLDVVPRSEDVSDATLYTTLEPCTHRHHPNKDCATLIRERGVRRVVVGILDPNPKIFGRGRAVLQKHGIDVTRFDEDLQRLIEDANASWIAEQKAKASYEELFAIVERDLVSANLRAFSGLAVGDAITIRLCPAITHGWPLHEVSLSHQTIEYPIPSALRTQYDEYFRQRYDEKGFASDKPKVMLRRRSVAFTDQPYLSLETQLTRYSHVQFYEDMVASEAGERGRLVTEALAGQGRDIPFPHALCLHLVVATADDKLLITRRSPEVNVHQNTWSCSIEENMTPEDIATGPGAHVLAFGKRALREELGLGSDVYADANLRLLSVFLESDILNVALCGIVRLQLSSDELRRVIRGMPRADYEFTAWDFLDFSEDELVAEIRSPSLPYHPTTRYRLLMALLHRQGMPSTGERWFTAAR